MRTKKQYYKRQEYAARRSKDDTLAKTIDRMLLGIARGRLLAWQRFVLGALELEPLLPALCGAAQVVRQIRVLLNLLCME